MSASKPALPPLPTDCCYLRHLDGMPLEGSDWTPVPLAQVTSRASSDLAMFQYSIDGMRWFSALRLDPKIAHEVFISCSARDYDKAGVIRDALQREGFRTYLADSEELSYAQDYKTTLFNAINGSLVVVAVLSEEVYRKPKWVLRELDLAEEWNKKIIPVIIDESHMPIEFEGRLAAIQAIRVEKSKPWTSCVEPLIRFVCKALEEPPVALGLPGKLHRLWRDVRRHTKVVSVWAVLLGAVVAITASTMLQWLKPVPIVPHEAAAAVVIVRPGHQVEARWLNEENKLRTGHVDVKADVVQRFRDNFVWTSNRPRKIDAYFSETFQYSGISTADRVKGYLRYSNVRTRISEDEAAALTLLGVSLNDDLSRIARETFIDRKYPQRSEHDARSFVVVHIDRRRILFVWPKKGAVRNSATWLFSNDEPSSELTLGERLFKNLKAVEEQRGPSTLSTRIVILCGEVPALAVFSAINGPSAVLDERNRNDFQDSQRLIALHYEDARDRLAELFGVPLLSNEAIGRDKYLSLLLLHDEIVDESDRKDIERVRGTLIHIVDALRIHENKRDVVLAPFIY